MVSKSEYMKALKNVAARSGVSTQVVEASYRKCVKKSAFSLADLFLANSVITLPTKKTMPHFHRAAVSMVRGVVSARGDARAVGADRKKGGVK